MRVWVVSDKLGCLCKVQWQGCAYGDVCGGVAITCREAGVVIVKQHTHTHTHRSIQMKCHTKFQDSKYVLMQPDIVCVCILCA